MSINDLEFPEEMLQSISIGNSQQEEQEGKLQGTVTKKVSPAGTKKDDKFKLSSKPSQSQLKEAKKSQTQGNKPQSPIGSAGNSLSRGGDNMRQYGATRLICSGNMGQQGETNN